MFDLAASFPQVSQSSQWQNSLPLRTVFIWGKAVEGGDGCVEDDAVLFLLGKLGLDVLGASANLHTLGEKTTLGCREERSGRGHTTVLRPETDAALHARCTVSEETSFALAKTECLLGSPRKWNRVEREIRYLIFLLI